MHFLVLSFQPVAGATGAISRVKLPVASRSDLVHPSLRSGKSLPAPPTADERNRQQTDLAWHRAQHRTQCRAACLNKCN